MENTSLRKVALKVSQYFRYFNLLPSSVVPRPSARAGSKRGRWTSASSVSKNALACCSTIITSQLPVPHWHAAIGDRILADAILDRLVHQAPCFNLDGESLRKKGKPA